MTKPKQDSPAQSRRFVEMAREHEAEGDNEELARAVKKLAPHKRKTAPKTEPRR